MRSGASTASQGSAGRQIRITYIESSKKSGVRRASVRNRGYHRQNTSSGSLLRTFVLVCNSRRAPRSVYAICCFLTNRRLTTWLMVNSTKDVVIVSPCRYRSPEPHRPRRRSSRHRWRAAPCGHAWPAPRSQLSASGPKVDCTCCRACSAGRPLLCLELSLRRDCPVEDEII